MKRLVWLLFLVVSAAPQCHAVNRLSDILSESRVFLKDQSTAANRQQFSDAALTQFANEGQREANAQNWLLQSSYTFTLSGGTTEYQMPSDFMFATRVLYQQPSQPYSKLPASSLNDLDARTPGWYTVSGTPLVYYIDTNNFQNANNITVGTAQSVNLGFYPAPTSASTGPVIVYYVQNTQDMSLTTDLPFNAVSSMQPYSMVLPYYVAYRGYLTEEETELASSYLQYWLQFLLVMRQGVNRQPDFNPPAGALRSGNPMGMGGVGSQ